MATTPEGKIKKAIKDFLKTVPECWFYMPVQSGMGEVGIPDIIGVVQGQFFGIEVKAPGKIANTTPNQDRVLQSISEANGLAFVTDDPALVRDLFKALKYVE